MTRHIRAITGGMTLRSIAEEATACRAAWAAAPNATFAWHCHHELIVEPLAESAESRIAYILWAKPTREKALRLRLFRPILGALPETVNKAWAAYDWARAAYDEARAAYIKAWAAADKAWAAYDKARAAADKARAAYDKARAAYDWAPLHAIECPNCPWDGRTIFAV